MRYGQGMTVISARAHSSIWKTIERKEPSLCKYRNLTIRGIANDEVAKASFDKLIAAGFWPSEMLEWLVGVAVSLPQRGKASKWLASLSMTSKQLSDFPQRLKDLADQVEHLNAYPLVTPDVWIHARPKAARTYSKAQLNFLGKRLMGLPGHLRVYAAFLEAHVRDMNYFLLVKSRESPQTKWLQALIYVVRKQTRRPMYSALADVLTAASQAAGTDRIFYASRLKMLDLRARRNKATPGPPVKPQG